MPDILPAFNGMKFGCDPEAFVFYNDRPVTAAGLIPGTKEEPFPVEHGAVQVDGMAAEFNIDPAETYEEFNRNITAVIRQLKGMLPKGHELRFIPSVRFSPDDFNAAPDEAKILGCNPDFNAWTGEINPPPGDPDDPYLRTASGHLHLGWTEDAMLDDAQHIMNCRDVVKQLDWYLGAWSVSIDADATRRKLYGQAGACRFKPYGVEYRVLSNFWLTNSDRRLAVWNRMQKALSDINHRFAPERAQPDINNRLIASINSTEIDADVFRAYNYPIRQIF